jgi:hypothetical protein
MTFDEYQEKAASFAEFDHPCYPAASLMVESAELADIFVKPMLRGDDIERSQDKILSEAGDVLWNLAVLLEREGVSFDDVAEYNLYKLDDRRKRGKIRGSGDNR